MTPNTSESATFQHNFSDYIVHVDESGDHSLSKIDENYPIFVLSFCIFKKQNYTDTVIKKITKFKFDHFGHDMIILHENEIRRDKGAFNHLKSKAIKEAFLNELTSIIDGEDFTIIACVIDKNKLIARYHKPDNPYDIAVKFCLERLYNFLQSVNQSNKSTYVIFEERGKKEDDDLELSFRRVCDGDNTHSLKYQFEIILANKQSNCIGLQLADLTARPIGLSYLKPGQDNRAFEIIKNKLYCNSYSKFLGYGLKIFP